MKGEQLTADRLADAIDILTAEGLTPDVSVRYFTSSKNFRKCSIPDEKFVFANLKELSFRNVEDLERRYSVQLTRGNNRGNYCIVDAESKSEKIPDYLDYDNGLHNRISAFLQGRREPSFGMLGYAVADIQKPVGTRTALELEDLLEENEFGAMDVVSAFENLSAEDIRNSNLPHDQLIRVVSGFRNDGKEVAGIYWHNVVKREIIVDAPPILRKEILEVLRK
ncbi:MAG: hypothetical protein ABIE55_01060 [Candidatus Aenigmatarchaeota archaeon]